MENIQIWVTLISSIVVLLGGLVGFIISFINAIKSKKIAVNKLTLLNFLSEVIKDAEQLTSLGGADKKQYVLDKVDVFAKENGLVFDAEKIGKAIDDIVDFTKHINAGK